MVSSFGPLRSLVQSLIIHTFQYFRAAHIPCDGGENSAHKNAPTPGLVLAPGRRGQAAGDQLDLAH